ncbi:MAG: hypothetical protein ABIA93_04475 [Candidatus Woesearchaeota archaeon]
MQEQIPHIAYIEPSGLVSRTSVRDRFTRLEKRLLRLNGGAKLEDRIEDDLPPLRGSSDLVLYKTVEEAEVALNNGTAWAIIVENTGALNELNTPYLNAMRFRGLHSRVPILGMETNIHPNNPMHGARDFPEWVETISANTPAERVLTALRRAIRSSEEWERQPASWAGSLSPDRFFADPESADLETQEILILAIYDAVKRSVRDYAIKNPDAIGIKDDTKFTIPLDQRNLAVGHPEGWRKEHKVVGEVSGLLRIIDESEAPVDIQLKPMAFTVSSLTHQQIRGNAVMSGGPGTDYWLRRTWTANDDEQMASLVAGPKYGLAVEVPHQNLPSRLFVTLERRLRGTLYDVQNNIRAELNEAADEASRALKIYTGRNPRQRIRESTQTAFDLGVAASNTFVHVRASLSEAITRGAVTLTDSDSIYTKYFKEELAAARLAFREGKPLSEYALQMVVSDEALSELLHRTYHRILTIVHGQQRPVSNEHVDQALTYLETEGAQPFIELARAIGPYVRGVNPREDGMQLWPVDKDQHARNAAFSDLSLRGYIIPALMALKHPELAKWNTYPVMPFETTASVMPSAEEMLSHVRAFDYAEPMYGSIHLGRVLANCDWAQQSTIPIAHHSERGQSKPRILVSVPKKGTRIRTTPVLYNARVAMNSMIERNHGFVEFAGPTLPDEVGNLQAYIGAYVLGDRMTVITNEVGRYFANVMARGLDYIANSADRNSQVIEPAVHLSRVMASFSTDYNTA